MKKTEEAPHLFEALHGLRLYRDDIEYIVELMRLEGLEIKLSDKGFEYDSLDEFIERRGVCPNELKVLGEVPGKKYQNIYAWFNGSSADVFGFRGTLFYELKSFLAGKCKRRFYLLNPWWWDFYWRLL